MRLQWSGDVDLNTGDLQQSYQAYRSLLDFISNLSVESTDMDLAQNLQRCSSLLLEEKEFLVKSMLPMACEYNK